MNWVDIKSRKISRARYDAPARQLDVAMSDGRVVQHLDIAPHVFQGLMDSPEPSFYYRYYIKPSAMTQPVPAASAQRLMFVVLSVFAVGAAFLLIG